jgi:hypothetical protein
MPERRSPHRARHASPPGQVTRSPTTAAGRGRQGNQDAPAGHAALRSHGLPAHTRAICALSAGYRIQDRAARNRQGTRRPTVPITLGDCGWSAASRDIRRIWSPNLGVLAVAAAGVLCVFCCLVDALPGQCLRRRPVHTPFSLLFLELNGCCLNAVRLHVYAADVLVTLGVDRDGFR